jgi:hypothetical protein
LTIEGLCQVQLDSIQQADLSNSPFSIADIEPHIESIFPNITTSVTGTGNNQYFEILKNLGYVNIYNRTNDFKIMCITPVAREYNVSLGDK